MITLMFVAKLINQKTNKESEVRKYLQTVI